jgi:hypothetical protein
MKRNKVIQHHLKVERTARYFTLEPEGDHRADLVVIHGYRQLAEYFIRNFQHLPSRGIRVIAPEGINRFYDQGGSGNRYLRLCRVPFSSGGTSGIRSETLAFAWIQSGWPNGV